MTFGFTGSTDPTTGTFVLQLTGFTPVITNVTYQSGSLFSGSFGLTSFTDHSMTFTGSTGSDFDAVGGATITFDIASRDVVAAPEPSSLFMAGMGLLGLGFGAFRRRVRG